MKYLGCAYYPEYWGRERVETDAHLMREAGINVVRIGEFAWCSLEPEEGVYTFEWLHECVQSLGRHGIHVILCTPTATPPAWLTDSYPDTRLVNAEGRRLDHGERRHYCYTSDTYWRHTARIVDRLAREFSPYRHVIGWQIDNEPAMGEQGICHCENCQASFQAWLKNKYITVDHLNDQWATRFWSMDYTAWTQIRLGQTKGKHTPSRALDTRRFASDALGEYIIKQGRLIRQHDADAVISTNLNGDVFTDLDFYKVFATMDIAMKDMYFDICTMDTNAMILDQFRSFKPGKPFWITETGAGMCGIGRPSHRDQFKAWMWSSYAHGADAYVVFRWRTCLSGQEQELEGLLEHSGHAGHRYRKAQEAFHQMHRIAPLLGDLPPLTSPIAMVHDYDVMWAYQSNCIQKVVNYGENFARLYRELYRKHLSADVIAPSASLDKYRLVILPTLIMIDPPFAQRLQQFVEKGGILLAQGQIDMKDRNSNFLGEQAPCLLQDLLGVRLHGGMYLFSAVEADESWTRQTHFTVGMTGELDGKNVSGSASGWIGDVGLTSGTALLTFDEHDYQGQPAITENRTGNGISIFAAAIGMDEALLENLFSHVLDRAGIAFRTDIPEHVEVLQRGRFAFVINHLNETVHLNLDSDYTAILGDITSGKLILKPYGVTILEQLPPVTSS